MQIPKRMNKKLLIVIILCVISVAMSIDIRMFTPTISSEVNVLITSYGVEISDLDCKDCEKHISPDKLSAIAKLVSYSNNFQILNITLNTKSGAIIKATTNEDIEFGFTGFKFDYYAKIIKFVNLTSNEWYLNWSLVGNAFFVNKSTLISRYYTISSFGNEDYDELWDIAIHDGNVYVVGKTGLNALIAKFDKDMNLIWSKGVVNSVFKGIAVDEEFIYAVGYSQSDGIVFKFDEDGDLIWQVKIGGDFIDKFEGVDIDDKYVYVVGKENSTGSYDAFIVKLDKSNGSVIWQRRIGSSHSDGFYDVEVYKDYIYAVGYAYNWDAFIVKFDKNGRVIWNKSWIGSDQWDLRLYDLVIHDDYLYVVGYAYHYTYPKNYDAFIAKLDLDGNLVWQKRIGGDGSESFSDVIVQDESVYTFGKTWNSTNFDAFVVKFDKNGNLIWQKRIGGNGYEFLLGSDVYRDYIYTVGRENTSGNYNGFLIKFVDSPKPCKIAVFNTDYQCTDVITAGEWSYSCHSISLDIYEINYSMSDIKLDYSFLCSDECIVNNSIILTLDENYQRSAIWYNERVDISRNFEIVAKIYLGYKDGADGVVFVIQNDTRGVSAISSNGGNLAYYNITPSIGFELDTWRNIDYGDPNENHIGLNLKGNLTSITYNTSIPELEDGKEHKFKFVWDSKGKEIKVYLDNVLVLSYSIDLQSILGDFAWIGFTGATGGESNVQYVRLVYLKAYSIRDIPSVNDVNPNWIDSWVTIGDAYKVNDSIVLTPDERYKRGAAWYTKEVDLSKYLWIDAKVFLGYKNGADGIVFVFQREGFDAIGLDGGNLAYSGIMPSVGVELDTWRNVNYRDPNENHIGLNLNGNLTSVITNTNIPELEDEKEHDFTIRWNPKTKYLDAYIDGIWILHSKVDLRSIVGDKAIIGFTGATGGYNNTQYFKIVRIVETSDVRDVSSWKCVEVKHVKPDEWIFYSNEPTTITLIVYPRISGTIYLTVFEI